MYEFPGVEGARNLGAPILSLDEEPLQMQVPAMPPAICPHCAAELYQAKPLTLRVALLRQLETYKSNEPTETRELCSKLFQAPDALELEDAEFSRLKAAVKANGFGYHDWVQGLLTEFLEAAAKVERPE